MHIFAQFDSQYNAFYAGQKVKGNLVVQLQEPTKFTNITVVCKGKAHVSWSERRRRTNRKQGRSSSDTVWHTAHEDYFSYTLMVAGASTGDTELQPGEHHYPFDPLPPSIPSSFEGHHGYVRYKLRAVMNRTGKLFGWDFEIPFTVMSPLDLNKVPLVKEPVLVQTSKMLFSFLCPSGPLELTVELPCSGFVSGQTIPIKIAVENGSKVRVDSLNCILRNEATYKARNRTKKRHSVVAKVAIDETVEKHSSKRLGHGIRIPPLPPSDLCFCSIIDLKYFCDVEAVVRGFHFSLTAKVPVTLGTIPLHFGPTKTLDLTPLPVPAPLQDKASRKSEESGPYTDPSFAPNAPIMPPDLPPPTYEECVVPKNVQVGGHLVKFVPRYPVWNFDQQP